MVSVVIPVYNGAAYVAAAVQSCLDQEVPAREVIVVDDGSTDGTAEVLRQFGDRVRVLQLGRSGLARARNAGAQVASGRYLAWMDADDLMVRDRLAVQAAALDANPELGVVSSDFTLIDEGGEEISSSYIHAYYDTLSRVGGVEKAYPVVAPPVRTPAGKVYSLRGGDLSRQLIWGNFVHPPTVMVRKTLYGELGGLDSSMPASWDYDFLLRASCVAVFGFVPAQLLRYRRTPGQLSRSRPRGEGHLATVEILARHARSAPALSPEDRETIRVKSAESRVEAAYKLAAFDRHAALRLWLAGVRDRPLAPDSIRALARIALPGFVLRAARALRRDVH